MAKVIDNDIIQGLSGKLGKQLVIRHMRDGRTIVVTCPDFSHRVFSQGQLAHQSRFQEASSYAKAAAKTQLVYGELARQRQKPAYNLTLSDWFHPPVIHRLERSDGRILVEATDNVMVGRVQVSVFDYQGKLLETAEAIRGEGDYWEFASQAQGKTIVAEAWDLPGHVARLVAQL